jgi:hypothetical protein
MDTAGRRKWYGCQKVGVEDLRRAYILRTWDAMSTEVIIKRGVSRKVLSNSANN